MLTSVFPSHLFNPHNIETIYSQYIMINFLHVLNKGAIWRNGNVHRWGGTFAVKIALKQLNSRGNSGIVCFENAEQILFRRSWLQPTAVKSQSRVTFVCNNSPIPLDQKHLKLLCWIKIEFSPLSYSLYQQQCIIPARSGVSCSTGLQRFTQQYFYFCSADWVTAVAE